MSHTSPEGLTAATIRKYVSAVKTICEICFGSVLSDEDSAVVERSLKEADKIAVVKMSKPANILDEEAIEAVIGLPTNRTMTRRLMISL